MYKDQLDEANRTIARLQGELADLRARFALDAASSPGRVPDAAPDGAGDRQALGPIDFAEFKRRLREDPEVIELLRQAPTIAVEIERPRLNYDATSSTGRLARLLEEGYFKIPRELAAIVSEFRRRGWMRDTGRPSDLNQPIRTLHEMGFFLREPDGFVAAPGMKIEVRRK